jgi:hypothetical protein
MRYVVYLSWSETGSEQVDAVRAGLEAERLSVCAIPAAGAVAHAGCLVVLLTAGAARSRRIRDDIHQANLHGLPLFALRLDNAAIPFRLRDIAPIDGRADRAAALTALAGAIGERLHIETTSARQQRAEAEASRAASDAQAAAEQAALRAAIARRRAYIEDQRQPYRPPMPLAGPALRPWHPRDWLRLLCWLLLDPASYAGYCLAHEQHTVQHTIAGFSTALIWVVIALPAAGLGLGSLVLLALVAGLLTLALAQIDALDDLFRAALTVLVVAVALGLAFTVAYTLALRASSAAGPALGLMVLLAGLALGFTSLARGLVGVVCTGAIVGLAGGIAFGSADGLMFVLVIIGIIGLALLVALWVASVIAAGIHNGRPSPAGRLIFAGVSLLSSALIPLLLLLSSP